MEGGTLHAEPSADPPAQDISDDQSHPGCLVQGAAGESEGRPRHTADGGQGTLSHQDSSRAKTHLSPGNVRTSTNSRVCTPRAGCTHTLRYTHSLCAHAQKHCRWDTHNGMHKSPSCSSQIHILGLLARTVACNHTPDAFTHVHSPCTHTM